ncbi:MAG: hypothetical protein KatS3mg114_0013 [Planctomycetaceae bacterium]|nr:MAG: hypothetical protein KatS3mg114_0013 [Planctomycetaceae bacterium]
MYGLSFCESGEYKSAAEPYLRNEISPEFRQELETLLDQLYEQSVQQIAESRKLSREQVIHVLDRGVLTARQALEHGWIDAVAYEDQLSDLILQRRPEGASVRLVRNYAKQAVDTDFSGLNGFIKFMSLLFGNEPPSRPTHTPKIAVLHAIGPIMTESSSLDLFGEEAVSSASLIKAIRKVRENDQVKAVVLRVDSPGGSALASDLIWRELKTLGKPLIASMGDTAASGGYYIAMAADRILADPGTLTGSIGVVGGKFALEGLYRKLGITHSIVQRGRNAGILSLTTPFTPDERQSMQGLLDEIYRQFTQKAAESRKLELERLLALAGGRIYTGEQARAVGLVDELGTLEDALAHARRAAGLAEDAPWERLDLPQPPSPLESLFGPLDNDVRMQALLSGWMLPWRLWKPQDGLILQLLQREPAALVLPYRLQIE